MDVKTMEDKFQDALETKIKQELEIAWLRGYRARAGGILSHERSQAAADYTERVIGGPTGLAPPGPVLTPSKPKNGR